MVIMGQSPQEFFSKNMKWFALAFLILFLFKSVQSCNRNMGIIITEKKTTHLIDSLEKNTTQLVDTVKNLRWENRLLVNKLESEKSIRQAVQSVAEKQAGKNTTIINNIPGSSDTTKKNRK